MNIFDRVSLAAEKIEAQGLPVTLARVRDELGGGSFTTINPALQKWKEMKIARAQLSPAPDDLTRKMYNFIPELWNNACQMAESRFVGERIELEGQINYLNSALKDAASAADIAIEERDLAVAKLNEFEASFVVLKENVDSALTRASAAEIRHQESELRIGDLQSQIDRLDRQNRDLEAKNSELAKLAVKSAAPRSNSKDLQLMKDRLNKRAK